jgi:ribosomal protein L13
MVEVDGSKYWRDAGWRLTQELEWRPMVQKTYSPKAGELERKWYVADAAGKNLGRFATRVAHTLLGTHKPSFTPGVQGGTAIVINAEQVSVTGTKTSMLDSKKYHTTLASRAESSP